MTDFNAHPLHRSLPSELLALVDLARDLRWTWSHGGDSLWRTLDTAAWDASQNPWFILQSVPQRRFEELAGDATFRDELQRLSAERTSYLQHAPSLPAGAKTAYFSLEFGLGSAIPLYAGGLGVLAGDYLKTASDLGLPVIGVGILYQEGYFRQTIDAAGNQRETYPYNDPSTLPIEAATQMDGSWTRVFVELPGRRFWLRVWRATVGRVDLLLLDGNDPANSPADRGITAKLYGGDPETRLLQEIVLGIGGPRALDALGISWEVAHMNEGHAAFVVLARARQFAAATRTTFREALWATRAGNLLTTHTPVSAGFDTFPIELVAKHFPSSGQYLGEVGFSLDEMLALGRRNSEDARERFSMVHFAIRGSAAVNGVSRVHAEVSRRLFAEVFPRWPEREVPIGCVTNGVHASSWDSPAADDLWTRACGKERWLGSVEKLCGIVAGVSDEDVWALRANARRELVNYARDRLRSHFARRGETSFAERAEHVLDPNVLTMGFARRFAEYKRPNLLLTDPERLARLLGNEERPVQLVVAGKAHPDDAQGKRMIAEWIAFFRRPETRARAAFLEDYDMALAEEMVRGVDVWLNTPRRPWEACGTSGMKVLVNGGLNLSELDGWWAEAWSPEVGWALGDGSARSDAEAAESMYRIIEQEIVPVFYDRDTTGIPRFWVRKIRASMSQLTPAFSSNRMVKEYAERYYEPLSVAYRKRAADGGALAKKLAAWAERLAARWHEIHFGPIDMGVTDGALNVRAAVYLGGVEPDSVSVEIYAEEVLAHPAVHVGMTRGRELSGATNGHLYEAIVPTERPRADFTVRVVPRHPEAFVPAELPLILWQQ